MFYPDICIFALKPNLCTLSNVEIPCQHFLFTHSEACRISMWIGSSADRKNRAGTRRQGCREAWSERRTAWTKEFCYLLFLVSVLSFRQTLGLVSAVNTSEVRQSLECFVYVVPQAQLLSGLYSPLHKTCLSGSSWDPLAPKQQGRWDLFHKNASNSFFLNPFSPHRRDPASVTSRLHLFPSWHCDVILGRFPSLCCLLWRPSFHDPESCPVTLPPLQGSSPESRGSSDVVVFCR